MALTVIIILLVAALICAIISIVKYPAPAPAPSVLTNLAIILLCIVGLIEHLPLGK